MLHRDKFRPLYISEGDTWEEEGTGVVWKADIKKRVWRHGKKEKRSQRNHRIIRNPPWELRERL